MALIGSLGSGVSAMQSFVKGMEVIGDNIANSKTVGFKRQRVNYSDNFSNTLRDSAPGSDGTSNRAAVQIGSGVSIGETKRIYDQGSIEPTGIASDLAIAGEGFFRVFDQASNSQFLTRDGSFRVDDRGYLADKNGHYLLGLTGGTPGQAPDTIGKVRIDLEQNVKLNDAGQPLDTAGRIVLDDGSRVQTTPLGAQYRVDADGHLLDSTATAATDSIILRDIGGAAARAVFDAGQDDYVLQDATGNLIDATGAVSLTAVVWIPTGQVQARIGDTEATAAVWDVASAFQPNPAAIDENDPNQFRLAIQSWSFGRDGDLTVSLNDGTSHTRAKLLLQQVRDPGALTNEGNGLLSGQQNAGAVGMLVWNVGAQISVAELGLHTPSSNGLGFIQGWALENSNTDLTFEFAEMITTQRAFQAGSRVITVSDEMLQEIINLKR